MHHQLHEEQLVQSNFRARIFLGGLLTYPNKYPSNNHLPPSQGDEIDKRFIIVPIYIFPAFSTVRAKYNFEAWAGQYVKCVTEWRIQ